MADSVQYSDGVVAGMQMLYGEGFLSPGGAVEMGQLLGDLNPKGLRVLDIGCGLGGCAIMLVREFGAGHVTGIDIEPELVARANQAVDAADLQDRINIHHVEPGPLTMDDDAFDLVLTKDVVCHFPDKKVIIADIFRVLAAGGSYLCADFFNPANEPETTDQGREYYDAYIESMRSYGLTFNFESQSVYEQAILAAGFDLHDVRDHTALSADVAGREKDMLNGDEAGPILEALGEERFKHRVMGSTVRQKALSERGLLHGHLHAKKPA